MLPRKWYYSLGRCKGRASDAPEPPDPLPPSGPLGGLPHRGAHAPDGAPCAPSGLATIPIYSRRWIFGMLCGMGSFRGRNEEERRGDTVAAHANELPDELASQ